MSLKKLINQLRNPIISARCSPRLSQIISNFQNEEDIIAENSKLIEEMIAIEDDIKEKEWLIEERSSQDLKYQELLQKFRIEHLNEVLDEFEQVEYYKSGFSAEGALLESES